MKKLYTLRRTLAAAVLLMMSALTWAHNFYVEGIYYNYIYDITGKTNKVSVTFDSSYMRNKYSGSIVIPSTVTYEGNTYTVTSIGSNAFYNCNVNSVTIPNSVTSIEEEAFYGCYNLRTITMSTNITSIGDRAFNQCRSITSIEIPNSVTSIGNSSFGSCAYLKSIEIPNSVTSLGNSVFGNCYALTSVKIGNGVMSIGNSLFDGCKVLTSIEVADDNPYYDSRDNCNAIIETSTNTLIAGSCRNTIIPNSVTSIGDYAFFLYENLTSIEIPNSVTSIGEGAFSNCTALKNIEIPNSVTSIGNGAFYFCKSLASIEIPNSITSIESGTFSSCTSLKSVKIPNSVTSIDVSAFDGCTSLTFVEIGNSATNFGEIVFQNCTSLTTVICHVENPPALPYNWYGGVFYNVPTNRATLYVPASAVEAYKVADQWKEFGKILPLEDYVSGIDEVAAEVAAAEYYTLDGIKVDNPTQKGIYIKGGKKYIIK